MSALRCTYYRGKVINPLLGFFGYHFFEVTIDGDITYVLITRQNITNCKAVSQVVQLTEYMILDANHAQ